MTTTELVGIGLYTPAEAGRLTGMSSSKITRWLHGHTTKSKEYAPLWKPTVDIGDDKLYLSFADLMEVRAAGLLMKEGLSAQSIRRAIPIARDLIGKEYPLSSARFKTDGHGVFLQVVDENGEERLINLIKDQYVFERIVGQSLRDIEFHDDMPRRWWPMSRESGIVVDPSRSFGQPIDEASGIPTSTLANAVAVEGDIVSAAIAWSLEESAFKRALHFELETNKIAA